MVRRRGPRLTLAEKTELWRRWRQGKSLNAIGRALGRIAHVVRYEVARTGGVPPDGAPSWSFQNLARSTIFTDFGPSLLCSTRRYGSSIRYGP